MKGYPCDPKHVDNIIIDYSFLIHTILYPTYRQQSNIYGKDMTGKFDVGKVFFINNYFVCVDTCLRMISIITKLMNYLRDKFTVNQFYFIHKPLKVPTWRSVYIDKDTEKILSCKELCEECKNRLSALSKYLTEEEIEEYQPYERLISKRCSMKGYTPLASRIEIAYTFNHRDKTIAKNRFFHCIQILQSQVSKNEWLFIYDFVLEQIQQFKNVIVLTNGKALTEGYEAAELALMLAIERNKSSMLISERSISHKFIYIMDIKHDEYYATTHRSVNTKRHNVPLFDRKRKPSVNKTLDQLFDLCVSVFGDKLLATDIYNIHNIFIKPNISYIKNKRSSKYEDFGRTYTNIPLDKEMCLDILYPFIAEYNKLFETNVVVR